MARGRPKGSGPTREQRLRRKRLAEEADELELRRNQLDTERGHREADRLEAKDEIERLRATVTDLIAAIDEYGGPNWRDPMVCCASHWEPLRKAVAAAEAAKAIGE